MTLSFPIATATLGSVDWPVVWGSALALVLASGAYIAVGLLFSVASESQVAAAVLTYVTLFLLVFGQFMASASTSTALQEAARHFTVVDHITGLLSGNVAPMNVAFFLLVAFVGLFLSARLLEARRWRSA
jgi:ABC-2 type transport system permease protein